MQRILLPSPRSADATNAYLIPGDPLTLVDTGAVGPSSMVALSAGLEHAGCAMADIRQVVITHGHADHCGLVGDLQAASGARVLVHRAGVAALANRPTAWRAAVDLYRRAALAGGVPGEVTAAFLAAAAAQSRPTISPATDAIVPVSDGSTVRAAGRAWRVIHTPGHAPDHICLYDRASGSMVVGDLLLRHRPTLVGLASQRANASQPRGLAALVASWRSIGRLPVAIAWPGHGPPVRAHRVLIARRLAELRARVAAARSAVEGGATTVWEVAEALRLSAAPEDLAATLSAAVSLLDWLTTQRRIQRRVTSGVVRYSGRG